MGYAFCQVQWQPYPDMLGVNHDLSFICYELIILFLLPTLFVVCISVSISIPIHGFCEQNSLMPLQHFCKKYQESKGIENKQYLSVSLSVFGISIYIITAFQL